MASLTVSPSVPKAISQQFSAGFGDSARQTRTVLTARGRRLVAGVLLVCAVLGSYALSGLLSAVVAASSAEPVSNTSVLMVVEPGDTLWSIAAELDPTADPRALVSRIATMNALSTDAQLQVGQTIAIPSNS